MKSCRQGSCSSFTRTRAHVGSPSRAGGSQPPYGRAHPLSAHGGPSSALYRVLAGGTVAGGGHGEGRRLLLLLRRCHGLLDGPRELGLLSGRHQPRPHAVVHIHTVLGGNDPLHHRSQMSGTMVGGSCFTLRSDRVGTFRTQGSNLKQWPSADVLPGYAHMLTWMGM
jgi:hypothetical protein